VSVAAAARRAGGDVEVLAGPGRQPRRGRRPAARWGRPSPSGPAAGPPHPSPLSRAGARCQRSPSAVPGEEVGGKAKRPKRRASCCARGRSPGGCGCLPGRWPAGAGRGDWRRSARLVATATSRRRLTGCCSDRVTGQRLAGSTSTRGRRQRPLLSGWRRVAANDTTPRLRGWIVGKAAMTTRPWLAIPAGRSGDRTYRGALIA
jgi:hypothetical protein